MAMGIFGIGVTGLGAAQAGLTTTSHNIANSNTLGFHRQELVQSNRIPQFTGVGFFGQGVQIDTVRRVYNQFLDNQVMQAQTEASQLETFYAQVSQLDNMLADPSSGLTPALQEFFRGVNDVAANPASIPARQSMISTASSMVARFQALDLRMGEVRDGVNSQIESTVSLINAYAEQIAALNHRIMISEGGAGGHTVNDLLDLRDQVIADLNKEVKASVVRQDDGTYSVFIGNGQTLVLSEHTFKLTSVPDPEDPERLAVGYVIGTGSYAIPESSFEGGTLDGLLSFRREILDGAQNALGRVALSMAQTFNDQHRLGIDLDAALGGAFFTVRGANGAPGVNAEPSAKVIPNSGNADIASVPAVTLTDISALRFSDYRLTRMADVAGRPTYQVEELDRGSAINRGNFTVPAGANSFSLDGLTIAIPTVPDSVGDIWVLQPTRTGARDIGLAITDTRKIAAGAPIVTQAALANTGSGRISAGEVNGYNNRVTLTFTGAASFDVVDQETGATLASNVAYVSGNNISYNGWTIQIAGAPAAGDVFNVEHAFASAAPANAGTGLPASVVPGPTAPNSNLRQPVTLTFTSPTTYNVTGVGTGNPVGLTYTAGQPISYNGWTVELTGTPAASDVFTIMPTTLGVADNRNALKLSALQTDNIMGRDAGIFGSDPTSTLQSAYSQMVSIVGSKTREIEVTARAQENLVAQARQAQQAVSGVNLDEEAAQLMRFQQAYQASAKVLQTATLLFDELLSIGR